jgi:hypothetical protein
MKKKNKGGIPVNDKKIKTIKDSNIKVFKLVLSSKTYFIENKSVA